MQWYERETRLWEPEPFGADVVQWRLREGRGEGGGGGHDGGADDGWVERRKRDHSDARL